MTRTAPTNPIPSAQAATFRDAGYLSPIDVFGPDDVNAVLNVVRHRGRRLNPLTRIKPHLLFPELWDLVRDPRILDPLERILGPDIFCIGSSTIEKEPHSDDYVAWHQDATFWGMDQLNGATAWLALTPSSRLSGCVQVLPGTHQKQLQHDAPGDPLNMLGAREKVRDLPNLDGAVALELAPGQMSLHHPLILHGSEPNRSDQPRIGLAVRYFSAQACQKGGSVTLVRGRNLSNMTLEQAPDGGRADLMRHAQQVRQFAGVIKREKEEHLNKDTNKDRDMP